ncbi:Stf0 family sulfotransferase [uncultured Devosia sp.]|uniref:Stf0 family sulfotransferase n=1 Tax=uncultured Devosia sp. TaxID=211434 RepID=UPI0035C99F37
MSEYASYVICSTPRSGSTLLCEMLAATGVSGHPNSYFRQQSIADWADGWGVERTNGTEDAQFDRLYLAAMLREANNDTGVFGLRLMWRSAADATRRLVRANGGPMDLAAQFLAAFSPTLYIHLSRLDKVAQAISLVRAEQSGLWHLAADGSVFEGTATPLPNVYDGPRIGEVFNELTRDDAAWEDFFRSHDIQPVRLVYEAMALDPQAALAIILAALGRDPAIAVGISVGTTKMSNRTSRDWSDRFRSENGSVSGPTHPAPGAHFKGAG